MQLRESVFWAFCDFSQAFYINKHQPAAFYTPMIYAKIQSKSFLLQKPLLLC
jgi:hypothetical protein